MFPMGKRWPLPAGEPEPPGCFCGPGDAQPKVSAFSRSCPRVATRRGPDGKTLAAYDGEKIVWWDVEKAKAARLDGPGRQLDPETAQKLAKQVTLGAWQLPGR